MSFSTIIVLGRYQSTSGPARGTVTFTRSATLRNTVTGEILLPYPVVAHLDSEGILRIALAANNDPSTTPADSGYSVQEAAGDCTRTYTIQVPYDSPNGTLDLVDKARGTPGGAVSLYAVTGGAGGGDLTPPVTLTGTDLDARVLTIQAPAALTQPVVQISTTEGAVLWRLGVDMPNVVANWDTDTVDWTTTLYLSHRLSSGSPDVGVGVGLALAVDNGAGDDVPLAFLYTEATAVAPFAGRLGLLVLRPDGSYTAPIYFTPTGLQLPLQAAPATPPPAGYVAFYADVADSHLKKQLTDGTVVDLG